ncbi:MAG: cyclic nucleotide-binding domain-containing protein, partial [Dehalococcoidia bacterium]|nr:cyclic nucleotide-binding domain-containing protein [Dehalococcoidia bacterium]
MKNFSALLKSSLFSGVSENELADITRCLGARFRTYYKGESIHNIGDFVRETGIVTAGSVHIVKSDAWGNQNIIAEVCEGEMFGEAFVCGGVGLLPVSIVAAADCEIMLADFQRIITQCGKACVFHTIL